MNIIFEKAKQAYEQKQIAVAKTRMQEKRYGEDDVEVYGQLRREG